MPSEQHLPYRSVADVVVLDGDGSRWVRERTCRNDGDDWGFTCSECGEEVSITKEIPYNGADAPYLPSYCPSCGAEVVDDA